MIPAVCRICHEPLVPGADQMTISVGATTVMIKGKTVVYPPRSVTVHAACFRKMLKARQVEPSKKEEHGSQNVPSQDHRD